ncbi:MAG: AMIN domain-containing protein [Bdellovibrionota bacterium]
MTYLRYQKKKAPVVAPAQPVQQQAPVITEIKQVTVTSQGQGAQVQIQGINSRNFSISNLPNGDGFKIQVPNAQAKQIQKSFDQPHPLIKSITVNESPENPNTTELVFVTDKNVNFLDTQKNDTLTIDFVKTEEEPAAPKVAEPKKPVKSKTTATAKATSKKAKAAVSKKSKSTNKTAKSTKKAQPSATVQLKPFDASMIEDETDIDAQAETLIPQEKGSLAQDKNDRSMDLNAFGTSTPSTESIPLGQEEVPVIEQDNSARFTDPSDNDGFNLKDVVKEEPKVPAGSANLLDAETEMSLNDNLGSSGQQVAALPNNQKFDLAKIQANLPALTNLSVQRSGNSTMVTFDREKAVPFKVFRMVNPSRVVVDFKDVKNGLKADYPRFTGTKISRVETRAYAGPDGQIVRVIMYVDGAPNYKSSKSGTSLVLELQ